MKRILFIVSFVALMGASRLRAEEVPQSPPSDRSFVEPGAYDDACQANWPNDTRCRQACLQAAACANDQRGPCRIAALEDCDQKRAAQEQDAQRVLEEPKK